MGWTEDGHLNIGLNDEEKRIEILEIIAQIAREKSLNAVIKI